MPKKGLKRISINALESISVNNYEHVITEQWFDVEISIRYSLPLTEMMGFVAEVVDACFTDTGVFMPEVMDFAIKSGVLTRYANFTLPANLEKQYALIYTTNAFDIVVARINQEQLDEIRVAVNRKIKYLCDSDIIALRSKMGEFVDAVNKVQGEAADIFAGLGTDDVKALADAVSGGGLDAEKVVEFYMDKSRASDAQKGE